MNVPVEPANNILNSVHLKFLNSAYLSELWAVQDLLKMKKKFPQYWNDAREKQVHDEINHASLLLNAIKSQTNEIIFDTAYSMQERLYKKYINFSLARTAGEHCNIHQITEHRAKWIYKTYLRINPESSFRKIIETILWDEKQHINIDFAADSESILLSQSLKSIDRMLFKNILPSQYGNYIFSNYLFWDWYYQGAQPTKNVQTELTADVM